MCKYALDTYKEQISRDHQYAREWADHLCDLGFDVVKPHTNIVLIDMKSAGKAESMVSYLASQNIHVQQAAEANYVRAVFHRSADYTQLEYALEIMKQFK